MDYRYWVRYALWRTNTPPLVTISKILWILINGWILFLLYLFAAFGLILTLIGIPFIPEIFKIAIFSFNPIGKRMARNLGPTSVFNNPESALVKIMNIIWVILFGWEFFLFQLGLAIIQFITIIGIGNGIRQWQIAKATLLPFGKVIENEPLPVKPVKPSAAPAEVAPAQYV
ncbi:hypothetical protein HDU85_000403 [Gaertneriomyces sp. JEL0708]|nr:hypothetical protein HDU85_000403 [Gaertneriomyces sp. JEL0708]